MSVFLVSAALDIFQSLIGELDTEGRYLFLNAIANQLRYPNNHTHYFSFILLYLFAESNQVRISVGWYYIGYLLHFCCSFQIYENILCFHQEIIQEQITRVLLERLIVNKPHPWGLLITFIELIKVKIIFNLILFLSFLKQNVPLRLLMFMFQNPRYNFWNRSFIRCAPEIEKLFESVARSCGGLKPVDESMVSGWVSDSAH